MSNVRHSLAPSPNKDERVSSFASAVTGDTQRMMELLTQQHRKGDAEDVKRFAASLGVVIEDGS